MVVVVVAPVMGVWWRGGLVGGLVGGEVGGVGEVGGGPRWRCVGCGP